MFYGYLQASRALRFCTIIQEVSPEMKRKHYPLVTALGALVLTLLPLLLLWLGLDSRNRADSGPKEDWSNPDTADNRAMSPIRVAEATSIKTPGSLRDVPLAAVDQHSRAAAKIPGHQPGSRQSVPKMSLPELALPDMRSVVAIPAVGGKKTTDDVPTPVASSAAINITAGVDIPTAGNPAFLVETELTQVEIAAQAAERENLEMPRRPDVDKSYYAATGHLALAAQPQVSDPLAQAPLLPEVVSSNATASKNRKDRNRKAKDDVSENDNQPSTSNPVTVVTPNVAGILNIGEGPETIKLLEEVALQTPAEGNPVGRIENVVAMTRAKGWPIALIKSDLPDDVWWVQQVVGIQGNAFAARVNFGNEYSIRGTMYHMVFVFLDSPDEVRRFRIAKQFKEIPAGVRRSRDFDFIRN